MGEKDYFLGGGALGEEDPSNEITLIRVNRSSEEGEKERTLARNQLNELSNLSKH